jgi:hypothetical protein
MTDSYKIKARPNIFELAVMDGVLNGGGSQQPVRREAYWAEPPLEAPDALFLDSPSPFKIKK